MKTTIDKAGRVVIPKAIRSRAGLSPGTELDVLSEDGSIRLVRSVPGPEIAEVRGRLVARPSAKRDLPRIDAATLVEEERCRWP